MPTHMLSSLTAHNNFIDILEDENQMLYFQCSAEFPGGLRCIEPAFDVLNELPLCIEHAKRQVRELLIYLILQPSLKLP